METLMSKLPAVARVVLGLVFTLFGANGFLQLMPMPPMPAVAGAFMGALASTGYMLPLLGMVQVGAGVMLLLGRRVPLALALLAPVLVNIIAFHVFLAPAGLVIPLVLLALEIYLAWIYRAAFAPMLQGRAVERVARRDLLTAE